MKQTRSSRGQSADITPDWALITLSGRRGSDNTERRWADSTRERNKKVHLRNCERRFILSDGKGYPMSCSGVPMSCWGIPPSCLGGTLFCLREYPCLSRPPDRTRGWTRGCPLDRTRDQGVPPCGQTNRLKTLPLPSYCIYGRKIL